MWQELAAGPWGLLLGKADEAAQEGRRGCRMLALTLPLGSLPLQGEGGTMGQGHFYRERIFPWERKGWQCWRGHSTQPGGCRGTREGGPPPPKGAEHHAQQEGCC